MRFFFSVNLVSTLFYFEFQIITLSNNQQQLIFQQNILLLFNISFFFAGNIFFHQLDKL